MARSNAGTGQPLCFRCSSCRKKYAHGFRLGGDRKGWAGRVELTGRDRNANRRGNAGCRNSRRTREYRCLDCNHVGWSRHIDLEHKAERLAAQRSDDG